MDRNKAVIHILKNAPKKFKHIRFVFSECNEVSEFNIESLNSRCHFWASSQDTQSKLSPVISVD